MKIHRGGAPAGGAPPWSVRWLKRRCEEWRELMHAKGTPADVEELQDHWPGGAYNPYKRKLHAWLHCHGVLMGMIRVLKRDHAVTDQKAALRALAESARREPVAVRCADGVERHVYPKSLPALLFLDGLRADLVLILERRTLEARLATQLQEQLVAPWAAALAYQLFAWVVTHEGVGLPFPLTGEAPEPPAWTAELTPEDLYRLGAAHLEVHRERLERVAGLAPDDGSRSILPVEGWVSAYAREHGQPSFEVLTRWSLGELYAQAVAAAIHEQEHAPAPPAPSIGDQPFMLQ